MCRNPSETHLNKVQQLVVILSVLFGWTGPFPRVFSCVWLREMALKDTSFCRDSLWRKRQIWRTSFTFPCQTPSWLFLAAESGWFKNMPLTMFEKIPVPRRWAHCARARARARGSLRNYGARRRQTNGFHVCRKTRWRHRKTLLFTKNTWNQSNGNYLPVVAAFVVCSFRFARQRWHHPASRSERVDGHAPNPADRLVTVSFCPFLSWRWWEMQIFSRNTLVFASICVVLSRM